MPATSSAIKKPIIVLMKCRWQKRLAQATSSKDNAGAAVQMPETSKDVHLQEQHEMNVNDEFQERSRSQPAQCDDSAHTAASPFGKTLERADVVRA